MPAALVLPCSALRFDRTKPSICSTVQLVPFQASLNGTSNSARRRSQRPHLLGKCGARTSVRFAMQDKSGWTVLKIGTYGKVSRFHASPDTPSTMLRSGKLSGILSPVVDRPRRVGQYRLSFCGHRAGPRRSGEVARDFTARACRLGALWIHCTIKSPRYWLNSLFSRYQSLEAIFIFPLKFKKPQ